MVVTEEIYKLIQDIVYENGFTRFDKGRWSSLLAFQSGIPFSRDLLDEIITNIRTVYTTIKNNTAKFYDKLLNGDMDGINGYIKSMYPDSITEVFNAVVKLSPETQTKLLPLFYEYPEFLSEDIVSNAITAAENTEETTTTTTTEDTFDLAEEEEEPDDTFDLGQDETTTTPSTETTTLSEETTEETTITPSTETSEETTTPSTETTSAETTTPSAETTTPSAETTTPSKETTTTPSAETTTPSKETTDDTFNLAEEDETEDDDAFDLSADTAEDRLVALLQQKMYHPGYRTYAKKMVRDSLSESKPLQAGRCTRQRPNQCAKITPGARRNVLRQVLQLEEEGQITEAQADLFIQNLALPESL